MITTRQIKVDEKRVKDLNLVTTKTIDVKQFDNYATVEIDGLLQDLPAEMARGIDRPVGETVTTHNLPDVEDIAEKKRRDEIMAHKLDMDTANVQNVDDEVGVPMTEEEEKIFLRQYVIVIDDEFDIYPMLRRYLK